MIESSYHNVSHRRRQGSQWQSHTQDLVSSDTFRRHTHRSYLYTARLGMDTSINLYLMQLNNKVYIMACICFPHQFSLKLKGTNMHVVPVTVEMFRTKSCGSSKRMQDKIKTGHYLTENRYSWYVFGCPCGSRQAGFDSAVGALLHATHTFLSLTFMHLSNCHLLIKKSDTSDWIERLNESMI